MGWYDLLVLFGFMFVCSIAASSGAVFKPGPWYDGLAKPRWVPPMWLFPVAWTVLYAMISVSGWLVWREVGFAAAQTALILFVIQLAFNAGWSALFFGLKRMDLALFELLGLWIAIAATIVAFARLSPSAAWLMAPYLAWVSFAGVLNLVMWRLNPVSMPALARSPLR